MRVPDLMTASERRLAALLFILSVIGSLAKCGRGISPEIEAWLDGAPGVSRATGSVDSVDAARSPIAVGESAHAMAGDSVASTAKPMKASSSVPAALVDPNTADEDALTALPGIGPALAARIVQDREANGPYATAADLTRVRGIGPATLARLRPYLSLP